MTVAPKTETSPFPTEAARRKRLGQYFTGARVARLLAALSEADRAKSILDPMAGSGDMLLACLDQGATEAELGGVEIDPVAFEACGERLREAGASPGLLLGDAFDPETPRRLPRREWDLVITNPPYVRYQSNAVAVKGAVGLPDAREIRAGLLDLLGELPGLDAGDRRLFEGLTRSYSGLADLAVPSWLLCATLVAPGGTLSMLVPTTWLSRDYALPVRYLLARCFDVVCVVEDAEAAWFDEALVRTTLVVARRVERRETAFGEQEPGHPHVRLTASAGCGDSLVGSLFPDSPDPEREFAATVAEWRRLGSIPDGCEVEAELETSVLGSAPLRQWARRQSWLEDPGAGERHQGAGAGGERLRSLEQLGWTVGQGLRTGANGFFYVSATGNGRMGETVLSSAAVGGREIEVPPDALRTVLRRQSELPAGPVVREADLSGRMLDLGGYALPEDLEASGTGAYAEMPAGLAAHVRAVAEMEVAIGGAARKIPELSAVRTNVRGTDPKRPEAPPRFWYQLPPLRPRHVPALLMARINSGHPRCYLNADAVVVDANFSTFWPTAEAAIDPFALFAALNSSWTAAATETAATVLGGGGLKVDATHLRRLAFPDVGAAGWEELARLGRALAEGRRQDLRELEDEIDAVLVPRGSDLEALRERAAARLASRSA